MIDCECCERKVAAQWVRTASEAYVRRRSGVLSDDRTPPEKLARLTERMLGSGLPRSLKDHGSLDVARPPDLSQCCSSLARLDSCSSCLAGASRSCTGCTDRKALVSLCFTSHSALRPLSRALHLPTKQGRHGCTGPLDGDGVRLLVPLSSLKVSWLWRLPHLA